MHRIQNTLTEVQARINTAAGINQRNAESITLLAVSKKQGLDKIRAAYRAGQRNFGENYLQEALEKLSALSQDPEFSGACWHFIGPIQSNKTRAIAEHFTWVHSVDRLKIARRLSEQRPPELEPLNLCLQINIDTEETKSGLLPSQAINTALEVAALPNIRLRGLMVIPRPRNSHEEQREAFKACRTVMADINSALVKNGFDSTLDTLSMGMSGDLEAAIAEGSTIVRIGTALFGSRT